MAGARAALVIATTNHSDESIAQLTSPAADAMELASILRDSNIGGFDTDVMLNAPSATVEERLEQFFLDDRRPNDLLLLYITGHGIKDASGRLYFATTNTRRERLRSTGVAASFVSEVARDSRARRQIMLLDCCYAGAFAATGAKGDDRVGSAEMLGGRGRAVLTASDALQYSFEGPDVEGRATPSLFTSVVIEGLRTGSADMDRDGLVSVDDLYDYVYDRVTALTSDQKPGKMILDAEGDLIVARAAVDASGPGKNDPRQSPGQTADAEQLPIGGQDDVIVNQTRTSSGVEHSQEPTRDQPVAPPDDDRTDSYRPMNPVDVRRIAGSLILGLVGLIQISHYFLGAPSVWVLAAGLFSVLGAAASSFWRTSWLKGVLVSAVTLNFATAIFLPDLSRFEAFVDRWWYRLDLFLLVAAVSAGAAYVAARPDEPLSDPRKRLGVGSALIGIGGALQLVLVSAQAWADEELTTAAVITGAGLALVGAVVWILRKRPQKWMATLGLGLLIALALGILLWVSTHGWISFAVYSSAAARLIALFGCGLIVSLLSSTSET